MTQRNGVLQSERVQKVRRPDAEVTDLFRLAFDHSANFVAILAADGALLEVNQTALAFACLERDAVVGMPLWETPWLRPRARPLVQAAVTRAARGPPLRRAFKVVGRDGRMLTLDVSLRLLAPDRPYILVEGREPPRDRLPTQLPRSLSASHRTLLDALGAGVVWHDANGLVADCNVAAERILRRSCGQLQGQGWCAVREDGTPYPEADHPALLALRTGAAQHDDVMGLHTPGGSLAWIWVSSQALLHKGSVPYAVVTSVVDITVLKNVEQALRHAALHDTLTGLGTRSLLYERLEHAAERLQRDPDAHFALLFVDLDGFKAVNDALGHGAGDALLVAAAQRLRGCVHSHDTVARLGGDEFAVLLEGLSKPGDAEGFAERVVRDLGDLVPATDQRLLVSASVGVALAQPGLGPSDLLQRADVAMYRAKTSGKARYCVAEV